MWGGRPRLQRVSRPVLKVAQLIGRRGAGTRPAALPLLAAQASGARLNLPALQVAPVFITIGGPQRPRGCANVGLSMSRTTIAVRNWIMRIHRWMGVAFCLLFLMWFASGIVMIYCRFPHVETTDRLARAASLDPRRIHIPPTSAFGMLHESAAPTQIRLYVLDGRPVYRFEFGRRVKLVFADDAERLDFVSKQMALLIAAAWAGFPATAVSFQGLVTDDQWTLDSAAYPHGPFWKYSWPNGEEVYVSQTTGEVVQDTTRSARLGAYCGAIPHWLFFVPLRRHVAIWSQVVIWLSGAGAAMSLLGLVAGIWIYSPSKRYRFPDGSSSIPYRGPKRWHVFLGLTFGVVTCTWVFSGFLSMEPFSWLAGPDCPNLDEALQGRRLDMAKFADKDPRQAIAEAGAELRVKVLEFASFDGDAIYVAVETPRHARIVPMHGSPRAVFDTGRIVDAVKRAVSPAAILETRLVYTYEPYYVDRYKQLPLPVIYFRLNDASQSAYYIDPRTGKVVQRYGARSRWNRWLYHGLHSMDLPWLYARRPAWDICVIALLLGGTALSITALSIAWKVVRRTVRARVLKPVGAPRRTGRTLP